MDAAERDDFVSEMYALAREEGFLYEAPLGVTDRLPSGDVVHGPWDPDDCAKVLVRWQVDGLVNLYVRTRSSMPWQTRTTKIVIGNETFYELSPQDAAELLGDPARWRPESEDGLVSITLSDVAVDIPYNRWRQLALGALGAD